MRGPPGALPLPAEEERKRLLTENRCGGLSPMMPPTILSWHPGLGWCTGSRMAAVTQFHYQTRPTTPPKPSPLPTTTSAATWPPSTSAWCGPRRSARPSSGGRRPSGRSRSCRATPTRCRGCVCGGSVRCGGTGKAQPNTHTTQHTKTHARMHRVHICSVVPLTHPPSLPPPPPPRSASPTRPSSSRPRLTAASTASPSTSRGTTWRRYWRRSHT